MASDTQQRSLPIKLAKNGFYKGFNRIVAVGSKFLIVLLILWTAVFSTNAMSVLTNVKGFVSSHFGVWYMYVMALFSLTCIFLALWPSTGKIKLGSAEEKPEFSRFSWISMLFGAGIGIGMLTYSTAEPMFHFTNNPDVIQGNVKALGAETVRSAYKWSFMHWGFWAWGVYAFTGLAIGYFSYTRGLPLTIRSTLMPLFGKKLSGSLGHTIDIVAVVATLLGVAVTIGFGISQFASGVYNISGMDWIMNSEGVPTNGAMVLFLVVIMGASTLSALSGVGKGIKWLSNLNMGLTIFVLIFFLTFGATGFALKVFFVGLWDYIIALPIMATQVWSDDGTQVGKALADWQSGWTIFYWAWWIAFAPFVGLFFARVSCGRTIREYVFGTMVIPSIIGFVWFAIIGGTALNLEITGVANGAILDADLSSQLYATINVMLDSGLAKIMSGVIVILLLTYLVTSADSAILVVNTIVSAGKPTTNAAKHILVWGSILTIMIATLLTAGGLEAVKAAMIIGALPFSLVVVLMHVSILKALFVDARKKEQSTPLSD
ncbi:MAG: BCCT family transporter [Robiginitomaculum sp.]